MNIRTEVSASAAAELAKAPPWMPRSPVSSTSATTSARAALSSPNTSTSHSMSSSVASLSAATLWKAETTLTSAPSSFCARWAALPSGGSWTRMTFGGTSGTVVSTTILPATCAAISRNVSSWAAKGTVTITISPAFAASALVSPVRPNPSSAAAWAALCAEREPRVTLRPALANLRAIADPSLPVPPITAMTASDIDVAPCDCACFSSLALVPDASAQRRVEAEVEVSADSLPDEVIDSAGNLLVTGHARGEQPVFEHDAGEHCAKDHPDRQPGIDLGPILQAQAHQGGSPVEVGMQTAAVARLRGCGLVGLRDHE